ncbi:hypothetical protein AQF98_13065 [Pedobacter sp. Hv1]|nr:hypothetical protein AQF98_13065 [Pedobacter sp. Hv1]
MTSVFGQDHLEAKMKSYDLSKPYANLFVHFDKNVYSNNETIWFTGYLLKSNLQSGYTPHVMSVALIRAIDSSVVMQKKYIMDKGIALGSMLLPDSIQTGNYYLAASTDIITNGKPITLFVQPVTLKTNIDPKFKANMKLMDVSKKETNVHQILIAVTSKEGLFLPKPTSISYRYGNSYKNAKTDVSGQLLISIPKQDQLVDPNIYVKLKYEKDSTFINMPLPQPKAKASVKFYPEGGNMIVGLPTKIAWEVKDQQNRPMALKAFLLKGNEVIDTIETSSYGIGKFQMVAENNHAYTVKLVHSDLADSVYVLPKAIDKGLAMNMANAVVQDTLKLTLTSNATRKFAIRIHNFRESFLYIPFDMEYNKRAIKIPLTEVPKGLVTLTISDSLDRPMAERMFFAHYDPSEKIGITTDQTTYKQREKVTLKLDLKDIEEQAIVSIACVQDNRLELKKMTDIESYSYLSQELGTLPLHRNGYGFADQEYLEQVLLIKGWRKYTWQDLQAANPKDTVQQHLSLLKISGRVLKNKKELNTVTTIGMFGNNTTNLVNTNIKGHFDLNTSDLLTESEKKLYLFANEKNKLPYTILVNDEFISTNEKIAQNLAHENTVIPSGLINTTELLLKNNEKATRLKEILVTAKNDDRFNYGVGPNPCGDYVCSYNILNCPNHSGDPRNTRPVKGFSYLTAGVKLVYPGCDEPSSTFFNINPLYLHKEFYINDYKEPQEPAFFSTLYWNYATLLKASTPTELNFYTSDITGKFRIVVQGVSDKGVIYSQKIFEVKGN